jgi:hypothetical protein
MVDLFKDYVNKNFISIADFLKQRNTLSASESSSSFEEQQEEFRTFSISLKKILRKDLPEEIENIIKTKIKASLENSSDYFAHFLSIVYAISIVVKNTTFAENDDGEIILEKSTRAGFNIVEVLPPDFVMENNLQQHIVSSLPFPDKIPDKYKKEFELLFTAQHLNLIHSHFFGTGVQQQNLEKYPVEDYLFRELASNGITKYSINLMLKNEQMLVALNLIITNIKNT